MYAFKFAYYNIVSDKLKILPFFQFLTCKYSPLPGIAQGLAKENHPQRSEDDFLLPSLAQSPAKDSPASKKPKNRLHGADHVKQTKKMKV
ncbi:MAG: hypothetical protein ACLUHO_15245 [Parabacteroides distasonis]